MKKVILGLIAIICLFAAICVTDNSAHEFEIRFIGVLGFGLSTFFGGYWDGKESKESKE